MLSHVSAHLQLTPSAFRGFASYHQCKCAWTLAISTTGNRPLDDLVQAEKLSLVYMHLLQTHILTEFQDVPTLQPPLLPQSLWISLLIQVVGVAGRRSYRSARLRQDWPSDSIWIAFTSLWILSYHKPRLVKDTCGVRIDPPSNSFSLIQGVLISADLCHWTSASTGLKVDDHHLSSRAMQPEQHHSLLQELSSQPQKLGQQYGDLRLYYDFRTTMHILDDLINTTPRGLDVLSHVAQELFPLRDYFFKFKHTAESFRQIALLEEHRLPDNHPLVNRFSKLLPTPTFFPDLLTMQRSSAFPLDFINLILGLCRFLLQPNQDQVPDAFMKNDVLQAHETLLHHSVLLLSQLHPPSDTRDILREISELVEDVVITYMKCGSSRTNSTFFLDYVFEHRTMLCITSILIIGEGWGRHSYIYRSVEQRPLDPAWDNAVEEVHNVR